MNDKPKDKTFRNWIRACMAVKCVRDGMHPLLEKYSNDHFSTNVNEVKRICNLPTYSCNGCVVSDLESYHNTQNTTSHERPNAKKMKMHKACPIRGSCDVIYNQIKSAHIRNKPNWTNTNCGLWCSHAWEQMKCYISTTGYAGKTKIIDADLTALVQICSNYIPLNTLFGVSLEALKKVQECRNELFHSSTMSVPDADLKMYISTMKSCLNLIVFKPFQTVIISQQEKLEELGRNDVVITEEESLAIIAHVMSGVRETLDQIREQQAKYSKANAQLSKAIESQAHMSEKIKAQLGKSIDCMSSIVCQQRELNTSLGEIQASFGTVASDCVETKRMSKETHEAVFLLLQEFRELKSTIQLSQPESKIIISCKNTEEDTIMTDKLSSAIKGVLKSTSTEQEIDPLRKACAIPIARLQEEGNTITDIKTNCIEIYINSATLQSWISLCENVLNGSIAAAFVPVQEQLRTNHGCENMSLELTLDEDYFLRTVRSVIAERKESGSLTRRVHYRINSDTRDKRRAVDHNDQQMTNDHNKTQIATQSMGTSNTYTIDDILQRDDVQLKNEQSDFRSQHKNDTSTENRVEGVPYCEVKDSAMDEVPLTDIDELSSEIEEGVMSELPKELVILKQHQKKSWATTEPQIKQASLSLRLSDFVPVKSRLDTEDYKEQQKTLQTRASEGSEAVETLIKNMATQADSTRSIIDSAPPQPGDGTVQRKFPTLRFPKLNAMSLISHILSEPKTNPKAQKFE